MVVLAEEHPHVLLGILQVLVNFGIGFFLIVIVVALILKFVVTLVLDLVVWLALAL